MTPDLLKELAEVLPWRYELTTRKDGHTRPSCRVDAQERKGTERQGAPIIPVGLSDSASPDSTMPSKTALKTVELIVDESCWYPAAGYQNWALEDQTFSASSPPTFPPASAKNVLK